MPSLLQLGGFDVQEGEVHMGLRGAWFARLVVSAETLPSGQVTLTVDGNDWLKGTVLSAGEFLFQTTVRLVGGAGGLSKDVVGAFQAAKLSDVLAAIAQQSGESLSGTIAGDVQAVPLQLWTLGRCTAAHALDELAQAATAYLSKSIGWRILPDGTLWMGEESWPAQDLPADSVIAAASPAEAWTWLGCRAPWLVPGVDLASVGQVLGVDHELGPDRMRSRAWTSGQLDVIEKLAAAVLGRLRIDFAGAPLIDRLALYRAKVVKAASDGSTVDVQPESSRLDLMQQVPFRHGPAVAVPKPGAFVLLGWEAGDSARPYARPDYELGATFTTANLLADLVTLGDTSGAQFVALANKVASALNAMVNTFNSHQHTGVVTGGGTTGAPAVPMGSPSSTAAAQVKAK